MFDSPFWISTILHNPNVRKSIYSHEFKKYDADRNGKIEETELANLVASVCSAMKTEAPSKKELHVAFQQFDTSQSTGLTISEFSCFFDHFLKSSIPFMGQSAAKEPVVIETDPSAATLSFICPSSLTAPIADLAKVHLIVKLLSGVVIADLTVENRLSVDEVRKHVTKLAGFDDNMFLQFTWEGPGPAALPLTNLSESALLCEVGISGDAELTATCTQGISGEFLCFRNNDWSNPHEVTAHATFCASGTAKITAAFYGGCEWNSNMETITFRYTLGPEQQQQQRQQQQMTTYITELALIQLSTDFPEEVFGSMPEDHPLRTQAEADVGKLYVGQLSTVEGDELSRRVFVPELRRCNLRDIRYFQRKQDKKSGECGLSLLKAVWT